MTTVVITYDCGMVVRKETTLRDDQTLLAHAQLGDTLVMQADAEHDAACTTCVNTYPGTDMLLRLCYGCEKQIESLDDMWVDYDSNCVICTECRDHARSQHDEQEYDLSVVRVTAEMSDMINELREG